MMLMFINLSRSVLEAKTRMYEKMTSGNYVPG